VVTLFHLDGERGHAGARTQLFSSGQACSAATEADPDYQAAMAGYHDLVDHGRREIYAIET
jgi:hypothetical protein